MRLSTPVGITLDLTDGWYDVTDDLPSGAPFTLAKAGGFGAFQLSSGLYSGGAKPNASLPELRELLVRFATAKGFLPLHNMVEHSGPTHVVGGSFSQNRFIRVWLVTDGSSFALATYTASEEAPAEVADCEQMVSSIGF